MSNGFLATRHVCRLQASDPAPRITAKRCLDLGASDQGLSTLCDTCFDSGHARVKLRERGDGKAQLIYSAERSTSGEDHYQLVEVLLPEPVIEALLGVAELRRVVALQRRTFIWEEARIHLDAVEGLGEFIEVEVAISEGAGAEPARTRLEQISQALAIDEESLVTDDYAELLGARPAALPEAH